MNESLDVHECIMSRTWMRIYDRVISHLWMSHVEELAFEIFGSPAVLCLAAVDSFICVTRHIHSYVCHDPFVCVTWLIHMCYMTDSSLGHYRAPVSLVAVWYSVLQCVAVCCTHCNTLQHTATHGNTLQRTVTHCNTLQHTATHCNTLQHTVSHCNKQYQRAIATQRAISHVTHMNEPCQTYEWVMPHIGMNVSCHTYEWVKSRNTAARDSRWSKELKS